MLVNTHMILCISSICLFSISWADNLNSLSSQLDDLTAQIVDLEQLTDELVSVAEKNDRNIAGMWETKESHCGARQYPCGMDTSACVSQLLLCDGAVDCPNGGDEVQSLCQSPSQGFQKWNVIVLEYDCVEVSAKRAFLQSKVIDVPYFRNVQEASIKNIIYFTDATGKEISMTSIAACRYYYHSREQHCWNTWSPFNIVKHFQDMEADYFPGFFESALTGNICARFIFKEVKDAQ